VRLILPKNRVRLVLPKKLQAHALDFFALFLSTFAKLNATQKGKK